jgi:hypothetical protein
MKKNHDEITSASNEEYGDHLLGTFFRDRGEELLLEDESDDRSETDLHHGTHLRNDFAIVEMLYSGDVDAIFLPDRIEVRAIGRYRNLLEQSATDEPSR